MSNQKSKVCLASGRPALTIAVVAVVVMALFSSAPTTPVQAAEKYPSRPIEGILPVGVGGGPDRLSRFIVPRLEKLLGVGMPVSNHPGAGGDKGMAQLTSRKADGYTFVTYTSLFMGKAASGLSRYNPLKELAFLPWLGISPSYLFVRSDSPWQSANELFTFARKNPETLRAAGFGVGSDEDFLVRLLADKGVVMTYVSYNKPNERYVSVLGGHNEVLIEQGGRCPRISGVRRAETGRNIHQGTGQAVPRCANGQGTGNGGDFVPALDGLCRQICDFPRQDKDTGRCVKNGCGHPRFPEVREGGLHEFHNLRGGGRGKRDRKTGF